MKKYFYPLILLILLINIPKISSHQYIFSSPGYDYTKYLNTETETLLDQNIDWNFPEQKKLSFYNSQTNEIINKNLIIDYPHRLYKQLYHYNTLQVANTLTKKYTINHQINQNEYLLIGYEVFDSTSQFILKKPFLEYYANNTLEWQVIIDNINGEVIDFATTDYGYLLLISHQEHYFDYSIAIYEINYEGKIRRNYLFKGEKADIPYKLLFLDTHFIILAQTNSQTLDFTENNSNNLQIALIYVNYNNFNTFFITYLGNNGDDFPIDLVCIDGDYYLLAYFVGTGYFTHPYRIASFYAIVHLSHRLEYVTYQTYSPNYRFYGLANQNDQLVAICQEVQNNYVVIHFLSLERLMIKSDKKEKLEINPTIIDYYLLKTNNQIFLIVRPVSTEKYAYTLLIYSSQFNTTFTTNFTANGLINYLEIFDCFLNICYLENDYLKLKEIFFLEYDEENNSVYVNYFPLYSKRISDIDETTFGYYEELTIHHKSKITVFTDRMIYVPLTTNIVGGNVYDIGIRLYFNGVGYLNDILIPSGYEIRDSGKYLLEIYGHNDRKIISFEVEKLSQDIYYQENDPLDKMNIYVDTYNNYQIEIEYSDFTKPNFSKENPIFIIISIILCCSIIGFILAKKKIIKIFIFVSFSLIMIKSNPLKLQAISKYLIFSEEYENLEIIESNNEAQIIAKGSEYYFQIDDQFELQIPYAHKYKIEKVENFYVIFYLVNKDLYGIKISNDSKIDLNKKILENVSYFQTYGWNGNVYLVGGIEEQNQKYVDAFIGKIDHNLTIENFRIFMGTQEEWFSQMCINEEEIIVVGYKDQGSGKDFGYGGRFERNNLLVVQLNHSFEILQYSVINVLDKVHQIIKSNDKYYIILENNILILNGQLIIVDAIKVPQNHFGYFGNELLITFDKENVYVYNCRYLQLEYMQKITNEGEIIERVIVGNKFFYVVTKNKDQKKLKIIDIIKVNNYYPHLVCANLTLLPQENVTITGPFSTGQLIDHSTLPYFHRLIDGIYTVTLEFEIRKNKRIKIDIPLEVAFECNVSQKGFYPVGYRLLFTGYGTLNGRKIYNNYQITEPGQYQLILENANNEQRIIDFYVTDSPIFYEESLYKKWDRTVSKGEKVSFKLKLPKEKYQELVSILLKGENNVIVEYFEDEEMLIFKVNAPVEEGVYGYFLEKIIFEKEEIEINQPYFVNVLKDKPKILINSLDNLTFNISIEDYDLTLRYLEVKVIVNNQEHIYEYNLSNKDISLTLPDNLAHHEIIFSLAYDLGDNVIRTVEIFKTKLHSKWAGKTVKLGSLKITKSSKTLEELSLRLTNINHFQEITYNQEQIYLKTKSNSMIYLTYVLIGFISLISAFFVSRKIIKSKNTIRA